MENCGTLYIVSTPIGNMKDITIRAIEVLESVDLIAAEDTRRARKLTSTYDIHTPLESYFSGNEERKAKTLLKHLLDGKDIAVVSESGTPGISDPGSRIIRLAIENRIPIDALPGPCALVTGLVLSGLRMDKFSFCGFLSSKSTKRRHQLERLQDIDNTLILYESPHRFLSCLEDIDLIMSERKVAVVREATKHFQEVKRGSARELIDYYRENPVKGEFVILIGGKSR